MPYAGFAVFGFVATIVVSASTNTGFAATHLTHHPPPFVPSSATCNSTTVPEKPILFAIIITMLSIILCTSRTIPFATATRRSYHHSIIVVITSDTTTTIHALVFCYNNIYNTICFSRLFR